MAVNHTYGTVTASNGVKLAYIKTSPRNVRPCYLKPAKTIPNSTNFGVNGGFFNLGSQNLLSIAVANGVGVGENGNNDFNSGWYNCDYARGTLVWDNADSKYQIVVTKYASEISVKSWTGSWAQGGISMWLQITDDNQFKKLAGDENMPNITGGENRTGLVYGTGGNIWLVVSISTCTALAFRDAIKKSIGSGTVVDGIFLDGGGSTQMKCNELSYGGNLTPNRLIPEMVMLIDKT